MTAGLPTFFKPLGHASMAAVTSPPVPDPAATALVRRVAALRRRDRGSAAVDAALATAAMAGPVLLITALIHRHLASLGTPLLALAMAAAVVIGAAAVAALRPRSLAATATRHDRLGMANQLLPAALDAALGRQSVDPAVGRLLIRQALEPAQPPRAPSRPGRPALALFFGLAAWLGAALLLTTPGHSVPATAATAPGWGELVRPLPSRDRAIIAPEGAAPATPPEEISEPALAARHGGGGNTAPTAAAAATATAGSGAVGPRRGTGVAPGGVAAQDRATSDLPPIRWRSLDMAAAGTVAAARGAGEPTGSRTGVPSPIHTPQAPASTPPPRLLSPGQRLLVAAFMGGTAAAHE